MLHRILRNRLLLAVACFCALFPAQLRPQQAASTTLRGQVTDPTGAVIPGAAITLTDAQGQSVTAASGADGSYELRGLAPGIYRVRAKAEGFAQFLRLNLALSPGAVRTLDIRLQIEIQQQQIEVSGESLALDTSASANAGAIVLSGAALDALSDDPDELANELQALAGPSAGPSGGQIYVDGFTGGQLPPKSSIREIRVNSNPFSAQYDKLGYGRIEVLTKPGTDKFHGQINGQANSSVFNSLWTPPVSQLPGALARGPLPQPSNRSLYFLWNVSGPINKKSSFFLSGARRDIEDNSIVSASVLDSALNQVPLTDAVPDPRRAFNIGPRVDYQLTPGNTLTLRHSYSYTVDEDDGVGQFALREQGYYTDETDNTLQIGDTQSIGANTINETHFQYLRNRNSQRPLFTTPTVTVQGAFTGGGSNQGSERDGQDRYELQNYTSMVRGSHTVKFGARLRDLREANSNTGGFNGQYIFPSLTAYQITLQGMAQGHSPEQIRADGGGASQYSAVTGNPVVKMNLFDAGLYVEDEWKARRNVTLNFGLRYEGQNHIADHADFAPRLGAAWGIGGGKTVLRAGYGLFYDRFQSAPVLQSLRQDGIRQQVVVVNAPNFNPNGAPRGSQSPANAAAPATLPTMYSIDPRLRASYTSQVGFSAERQLSASATASVTYLNSRGVHTYLTRNINAPLPGTYDPSLPSSGERPNGRLENIYQYSSGGIFKQNQLILSANVRSRKYLTLFGYYVYGHANADSAGVDFFPSNQYDVQQDYGRAAFDIRHRAIMGGSVVLPYNFALSPLLVAQSGLPFNLTVGQDLNGDSQFNDRPRFAGPGQCGLPSIVCNRYGQFDLSPSATGRLVPINYGNGPARFTLNLRMGKTFAFGPKVEGGTAGGDGGGMRGGGGRGLGGGLAPRPTFGSPVAAATNKRYGVTLNAHLFNVFDYVNYAQPVGVLSSPLFGRSNALAKQIFSTGSATRLLYLQAIFNF